MNYPKDLSLSAEDIRYARASQLSALTGIKPSSFINWSRSRSWTQRTAARIAAFLGVEPKVVHEGLELRQADTARAEAARAKFAHLIEVRREQEQAS